ncbi:type I methionyl aminopeptidase [bacterium]|nr:type I methionyl aminopeptidase [bacterium]
MNAIHLKSPDDIEAMYRANRVVAEALRAMYEAVRPGVSTGELDRVARRVLEKHGARSAFLNYPHSAGGPAFPATVCASVNEVIVHGIPSDDTIRKDGDIVSLDFGAILDGWVGDSAITVAVGAASEEAQGLLATTKACLTAAIEQCVEGNRVGDISHAVQVLAEGRGYGVVSEFVGHGIGRRMHEAPPIPNVGRAHTGERLRVGMVFAIEPMINEGSPDVVTENDGWTARTADRKLSAHFEHSVAITPDGPRVLSVWE